MLIKLTNKQTTEHTNKQRNKQTIKQTLWRSHSWLNRKMSRFHRNTTGFSIPGSDKMGIKCYRIMEMPQFFSGNMRN